MYSASQMLLVRSEKGGSLCRYLKLAFNSIQAILDSHPVLTSPQADITSTAVKRIGQACNAAGPPLSLVVTQKAVTYYTGDQICVPFKLPEMTISWGKERQEISHHVVFTDGRFRV